MSVTVSVSARCDQKSRSTKSEVEEGIYFRDLTFPKGHGLNCLCSAMSVLYMVLGLKIARQAI